MTQTHKAVQEQTGKIIENAMSQALTKKQDTTISASTTLNTSNQNVNYASPPHSLYQTPTWHTTHPNIPHPPHVNTILQMNTQSNRPGQQLYHTPTNLNQSVADLLRCQTDLAHYTQCLHQQTTDVLCNIAKSSALQENVPFINDIIIFKAKDPQSFDEWLDQINMVIALTNNIHIS